MAAAAVLSHGAMTWPSVAVVDIGSNTIKVLVAARSGEGRPVALLARTIEARISAGIGAGDPRLGEEGMARGLAAIRALLEDAERHAPAGTLLVATSAVRDAANGADFCARIRSATGRSVRILSGMEEAALIGRGLLCDPGLAGLGDFFVVDLGGGSLECLQFSGRRIVRAASLQLGCVRLTEACVGDPARPFEQAAGRAIAAKVRLELDRAGLAIPAAATVVGTGGTLTTLRAVLAGRPGVPIGETDPIIPLSRISGALESLGAMSLEERREVPGLPPGRADVFPAALATLEALARISGFGAYRHSLYNLRWGVAAEALGAD
jgi:exopolyphosphatase/guanosine-5'-triphosphate,3'-diphosphate pyrophosphatase